MNVLLVYPNLPLMMAPAMSIAIFNAICKEEGCNIKVFETTMYSRQYDNRHIRMAEVGASRQNKEQEIKDMFFIKSPDLIIPDFLETVDTYKPDLILYSVQEDTWKMATLLIDAISDRNIQHLIGGVFPTSAPNVVISHPNVKAIAIQEGENIVRDAIRSNDVTSVKGVWYKDANGKVVKNSPQQLCDITKIIPDYDCFADIRWNRPMGGKTFSRAVSMETYRGCPYNCTYCNSPNTRNISKDFNNGKFLRRKPAHIVERDLLYYKEKIDPDLIMFQDDSFLARPEKEIFEFCEMWSKYKIPFWFNTRIENCKPNYLKALKEAGVYRMSFGLESGNEAYRRDVLKRNVSNKVYEEYFEYINDSNIPYSLNIIIGMPFETRSLVMDTASLVNKARGYDGLTIAMFQPYWGTDLRRVCVENGFLPETHINGFGDHTGIGGFLDTWHLKMPQPYLQEKEVYRLLKTFSLYAFHGQDMWDIILQAETDDVLYEKLMSNYRQKFFTAFQAGGAERIQKFCTMHDPSSTYHFEEAND
jgi:anaerobic magnesium-protoporphyrin IX monomethyl ester cyclase